MCAKKEKPKKAAKPAKTPKKEKPVKDSKAAAKPAAKPVVVHNDDPDFVHMVRLAGVVVDGNLTLPKALAKIKGIGPRMADSVLTAIRISSETKVGNLSEQDVADIEKTLEGIIGIVPSWMLNRQRDIESGENMHRLGPELDMQLREDINREKKTKSYRGIRHSLNLPVRGQRTRSTFRKGASLGVSRKKAKT